MYASMSMSDRIFASFLVNGTLVGMILHCGRPYVIAEPTPTYPHRRAMVDVDKRTAPRAASEVSGNLGV